MPPKSSSQPAKKLKTQSKISVVKLGASQPLAATKRKFDPLSAFSNPASQTKAKDRSGRENSPLLVPDFANTNGAKRPLRRVASKKGKEKAPIDDRMWVDIHEPTTEAELAVHVRKVDDVRRWLNEAFEGGPSGKLKKYRRILAMTGPAGTGKTSTLRVLAKELDLEIIEWKNSIGEVTSTRNFPSSSNAYASTSSSAYFSPPRDYDEDAESQFTKFSTFFTRAASCRNLFSHQTPSASTTAQKQIILLEDLPNILHPKTQEEFHACLKGLTESPVGDPPIPVVIVISDAGIRGEARDERIAGGGGWGRGKEEVLDVRSVVSRDLLNGPYVTQIPFNPIAPTLMKKALQSMVTKHFSSPAVDLPAPSKQVLDVIVESSNGDIRSAINTLEFACTVELPSKKRRGGGEGGTTIVLEAVTRRESSLALFHLIGKVLYNKRKGDPSNSSATAKDIQKERELDARLKDPPKLPAHLSEHDRRASRVDVDTIYADSPIDSSLFSLYLHQNYTQFCNEVDEVEGVAGWLSWVDSSGGEAWYQANPHQFHLLTLGTLHSLPSPVQRRSQKVFKPEYFEVFRKEKEARDAVRLTRDWVVDEDVKQNVGARRTGAWPAQDVILELGAVLRCKEKAGAKPPRAHRMFSSLPFVHGESGGGGSQLAEGDDGGEAPILEGEDDEEDEERLRLEKDGGWLEDDDIEDDF
ncbi:Rad17 cell cycle checkpoint protein-domain-containing protein [Ephemerocybe angulata]|uniref:Rad17 cell cycle checkpoint protein-domain-containing protein n=1 Tax=Ephemerocybe angulata TaxID=980116 RepID=A0A8H6HUT4_9AGAR|nr:Rad17 cell cycle checkpoint protein-domain-containing protein [Tulosesus angulatus]